ncbi:MAG: zinc metalloprotease HtpX, partial [Candidatus Dormibacteraeota bacterium]|nr:zinc metalloprotease HtpX [Candidatus Dormibacteraeota bacterium]
MFHQIARNKRKSVTVVIAFFLVWIGAGVGIGKLASLNSGDAGGMIAGGVIAGILAMLAVLWAL